MTATIALKDARKDKGLSQSKLAELAGVCQATISRIESDSDSSKSSVRGETATRIARVLGLPPNELRLPHGTSERGRPPGTGGPLSPTQGAIAKPKICSGCNEQLPNTGKCDNC